MICVLTDGSCLVLDSIVDGSDSAVAADAYRIARDHCGGFDCEGVHVYVCRDDNSGFDRIVIGHDATSCRWEERASTPPAIAAALRRAA